MEYRMAANDVVPLIKSVADEFEVQAHEKAIQLRLESDEPALFAACDRERIVQVIGNLYENALKFSPAGNDRCDEGPTRESERDRHFCRRFRSWCAGWA